MGGGPAGEGEAWAGKAGRKFKSLGGRRGRKYATKKGLKMNKKRRQLTGGGGDSEL